MVQTRSASKRVESGQTHNNGTVIEPPQESIATPRKRQCTNRGGSSKKRRRGKPDELCQLNLDVLFLIAAYVHPLDLLNLARTCKSLRELLMDKSSMFVWKRSRQQVDNLPYCPSDLTEPEYANLVFYARCHGCGKYAPTVLWKMRRRYCPGCRSSRLMPRDDCDYVIRSNYVIAAEQLTIDKTPRYMVDREQANSFMEEYNKCSDKPQFLADKSKQYFSICDHSAHCKIWGREIASQRKANLELRRVERENDIFRRIEEQGYQHEVEFGRHEVICSHKSLFKSSRTVTDKEWSQIWPGLLKALNRIRIQRLDLNVYQPRRNQLAHRYDSYVADPSFDKSAFSLLPDKNDLSRFPQFEDIIKAPEESQVVDTSFEPALTQLPILVEEWKKNLDAELADLVKVPSELSPDFLSSDVAPIQAATDKLRLACAVFKTFTIFTYPDVLHAIHSSSNMTDEPPSGNRFDVALLVDAPYIVRACGLDPCVATAEDMDHRNARVKCMSCRAPYVRGWRDAMHHAFIRHSGWFPPSLQWESISDEHINDVETAELSIERVELSSGRTWCLLCIPRVGDAKTHDETMRHLSDCHGINEKDAEQDVHFARLGVFAERSVRMVHVEEGGKKILKFMP